MRIAAFAGDLAREATGTQLAKWQSGGSHDAPGSPGEGSLRYPGESGVRRSPATLFDVRPARCGRPFLPRTMPWRGHTGVVFLSAALPGTPLAAPVESGPNHYNASRPQWRTFRRHS